MVITSAVFRGRRGKKTGLADLPRDVTRERQSKTSSAFRSSSLMYTIYEDYPVNTSYYRI